MRLLIPGWEGNICIKWLRRLKMVDQPFMTREETSNYTDLMPDGTARQFTLVMDAKSVITFPSGGQRLPAPGFSRSGPRLERARPDRAVEVSTDGGAPGTPRSPEPGLPVRSPAFAAPGNGTAGDAVCRVASTTRPVTFSRRARRWSKFAV